MKRSINGFDIDWVGNERLEATRKDAPKHTYLFETSADRQKIKRLYSTSPASSTESDPLLDAERFEEDAREAAKEFLRQESVSK